ncbi:MAG: MarC family NAAT transporter [Rubrivivax sp.]|nr:MarC family NAAT transporter [Rubrivivax sp.]
MTADLPTLLATFGAGSALSVLSLMNPPATLPLFLAVSQHEDERGRRRMARRACLYCFGILVVSLFAGSLILRSFGISLGALRVAGGLVVMLLGHGLLYGKTEKPSADDALPASGNPTFFPLAMPGITGPGQIAVVIGISTEVRELGTWGSQAVAYAATVGAMLAVCAIEWAFLRSAARISAKLGRVGTEVITRLSGFLLVCVGVQFVASGVRTLITAG